MRRLLALTAALLLALAGCGSDSDDTSTETTTPTSTAGPTTTTQVEWTEAMQNACTAEADALSSILQGPYGGNARPVHLNEIIEDGYLDGPPTYWTIQRSVLIGLDANEDERCGGIYLP